MTTARMAGTRRSRALLATGAALSAVALVAGCGGSNDSGDSVAGGAAPEAATRDESGSGSGIQATPGGGDAKPGSNVSAEQVVAQATKRVRTAQVTVEVKNLTTAAAAVRQVATDLGGIVGSETTGYGAPASQPSVSGSVPGGQSGQPAPISPTTATTGEAVITLRVPEPKLDTAMQRVSQVGKELTRTTTSEDVTATLADLGSRVATQQRSLERVRALLARASSLSEIVSIEAELSRREADLEALQARQRALSDQAALSSLTAILRLPDVKPPSEEDDDEGFLAGLEAGWKALVVSTMVVLTVLGALLPPLAVLLLLGVPLYLLWRRYRPARAPRPGRPGPPSRTPRPGPPAPPAAPGPPAPSTSPAP
jgi:hypothetical protein